MQAEFICLEDKAFKAVIDKVVAYVKEIHGIKEDKWISPEKAMEKLNCGKTTLQSTGTKILSSIRNCRQGHFYTMSIQ